MCRHQALNNCKKCGYFVGVGLLYLVLSISIAFLWHRLFFYDTPPLDAIKSVFAGSVFVLTLLGLVLWTGFRVFVFLLVPKLFNVNGRTVLITYISYLTLTGPVWNTTRNIGVMSTTLVCAFEELRRSTEELRMLLTSPIVYIKHLIDAMEARAKAIFAELARDLQHVQQAAQNMLQYFRKAIGFLKRLSKLCEDKLGSPVDYCAKMVKETIENCEIDHDNTVCSPLITLYPMCAPLYTLEVFCIELNYTFLDVYFVEHLQKGFERLQKELMTFVDVDVGIDGDFAVKTNASKTYAKVVEDVKRQFNARTETLFVFLESAKILSLLFSFYLFFTVYRFKHKYLNEVEYQNRYLLKSFKEINNLRVSDGESSVFPLNYEEERHFIVIYSWRLTYWEVMQAIHGIADVVCSCFYVFCILFGDYALYYLMLVITQSSRDTNIQQQTVMHVQVTGQGFVADYMRSVVGAFAPILNDFKIDYGVCAPQPHHPDTERVIVLILLCLVCLLQSIVYPFAARFMHLVMARYYVDETRQRMIWLYHDIIRRRKTWQLIIQERLSGTFGGDAQDPIPIIGWLRSQLGACWIGHWFLSEGGLPNEEFCTHCGKSLAGARERVGYFKCPTYGCAAVYCRRCIKQLKWVCILCKKNVNVRTNYGDLALEEGVDLKAF